MDGGQDEIKLAKFHILDLTFPMNQSYARRALEDVTTSWSDSGLYGYCSK